MTYISPIGNQNRFVMPFPAPYIAILDIGHGNSCIIRDSNQTIVIDCGARGSGLLEFLEQEGITEINQLFISHADQDHIGGLLGIISLGKIRINNIFVNSDATKGSGLWEDLTYELSMQNEAGITKFSVGISRKKETIDCGDIQIAISGPTPYLASKGVGGMDRKDRNISSNSLSASFHIFWKGQSLVYLAGDIDQVGLDDLLDHRADLKSDLLVFPHHGGKSGHQNIQEFTETLCSQVNPSKVIFSIGRNKFDNPRPEVVDAVRKSLKSVRVSCSQLSVNCSKVISVHKQDHLAPVFSRGREENDSCGGTFLIKLGEKLEYIPDLALHHKYVGLVTTTPMCLI
jgi:beta-lactamase superfamily II metal-dependent hydrolase